MPHKHKLTKREVVAWYCGQLEILRRLFPNADVNLRAAVALKKAGYEPDESTMELIHAFNERNGSDGGLWCLLTDDMVAPPTKPRPGPEVA